jgi:hypothetical protein
MGANNAHPDINGAITDDGEPRDTHNAKRCNASDSCETVLGQRVRTDAQSFSTV